MIVNPHLVVTKTAPATANPGEIIVYTISYQNVGTDWAYNVVITDAYPPNVTFISAIPLPDIPTDNVWTIGSIAPGGSGIIEIIVQVDMGASGALVNYVELTYENGAGIPQPPVNDTATTMLDVPDLYIYPMDIAFSNQMPYKWEEITISATIHNNDITQIFDIPVQQGWNLVSVPLVQNDTSIHAVLGDNGGDTAWDYAMYYDATDANDPWKSNCIYRPESLNDLTDVDHTMSIYVNVTDVGSDGHLTVKGTLPPIVTIPLWTGWNMVGYPSIDDSSYTVADVKASTNVMNITILNSTTNISDTVELPDDYTLKRGEGYWFNVSDNCTWTIENEVITCTVSFYLDNVSTGGLLYREYGVPVPVAGSVVVTHDWVADVVGNHTILVEITESDPPETDLSNNLASNFIFVLEPAGKLKVKATSDKQRYVKGVDVQAEIIIKVTYLGQLIENATVSAWVIDPVGVNISVPMSEASSGVYTGTYPFTNASSPGTYRIKAIASKAGYINGANNDKDKFFLASSKTNAEILGVQFSPNLPVQGTDVTITLDVNNYGSVSSVHSRLTSHDGRATVTLPVYDDGTHSDVTPGDGTYTNVISTGDMDGTYATDILVDGILFESRGVLIINPQDMIAFETVSGLQTTGGTLYFSSALTNTTVNLTTVLDLYNISFTIVEYRTTSEGKRVDIIPSSNVNVAMLSARIELSYTDQDIPSDIKESDMRLYLFDYYTGNFEPCQPGGVSPMDDIIWGDTEHFSGFRVVYFTDVLLEEGWNLISLPLAQTDTSILSVLSSIDGKWDYARYYDASDPTDPWKSYATFKPPCLNDLQVIDHTMAIWLNATAACTLTITGIVPSLASTSIPLYSGWNFVGYPTLKNYTIIVDALWGTGADKVEGSDPGSPYGISELPPTYVMKPGEGYWIHVAADTTWVVDW